MSAQTFCIPADHPSLPGHFPGNPVVPGAVILDHVLAAAKDAGFGQVSKLASVKFRAHLMPEQTCAVTFSQGKRGVTATCLRDDATVLTCLFTPADATAGGL